jgi:ABC-type Mn2+/Zn2+ transport system permease subunit
LAVIGSLILPGLGQIYNGEWTKGAVLVVGSVVGMSFLSPTLAASVQLLSSEEGRADVLAGEVVAVSPEGLFAMLVLQVVILFSLWDAYRGPRRQPPAP